MTEVAQSSDDVLQDLLQQRDLDLMDAFNQFDVDKKGAVEISTLVGILDDQLGLNPKRHDIKRALMALDAKSNGVFEYQEFAHMMLDPDNVIQRAITGKIAIPHFVSFCTELVRLFLKIKAMPAVGKQVDYIPELSAIDPKLFSFSICTVDGQQFSYGDSKFEFTMEGTMSPFTYLLVLEDRGITETHRFIGREPSGGKFNEARLNKQSKPHNPIVNTGAITICSMIRPEMDAADRFDYVTQFFTRIAGGKSNAKLSFNQPKYLSEKETGDQNYALAYYMKSVGVFGKEENRLEEILDLYFQLCSISTTTPALAAMAATLAAGGRSPLTNEKILQTENVKTCLACLYSCGMFDFSGEWAFTVGLPAKSGVSGALFCVVPNLMGIAVFSPLLDKYGHSEKGVEFCKALVNQFQLSVFDRIVAGGNNSGLDVVNVMEQKSAESLQSMASGLHRPSPSAASRFDAKALVAGPAGGGLPAAAVPVLSNPPKPGSHR